VTDLWIMGNQDMYASGGFGSPAPPSGSTWTWDVFVEANASQWAYARTSVNSFAEIGGGSAYVFSGIVQYTNVDANGITNTHWVGQNTQNGVADFINDSGVVQVTFGWGIGADNLGFAQINLEVWVS
jgi:hypothetical protein